MRKHHTYVLLFGLEFIYLFIMKFVQLGTQIKARCEKNIHIKIPKMNIMKYIKTIS